MFGSYNKFDARVHVDAHIVSVVDFLTSLLASIVVFSTLGHSAHVLGVPVETVAKGGQGLAFVAYPEVSDHYRMFNFIILMSGSVSTSSPSVLVNHFLLNVISSWLGFPVCPGGDGDLRHI